MTKTLSPRLENLEGRVGRIAALADEIKGEQITVLDMRGICDFADAFVIVTARSRTQMNAIARNITEKLRDEGLRPINGEEPADVSWTLIDYGNVIVHIMNPEARAYYDLESLWGDAKEMQVLSAES
ncbi:ribosome silencing factor [bacterium]|nr:ribosome silencing factor [bacterium]